MMISMIKDNPKGMSSHNLVPVWENAEMCIDDYCQ
jgi:hypothetical protein